MFTKQNSKLLCGSALLLIILAIRFIISGRFTYGFLIWNLFLAWLPVWIAQLAVKRSFKSWKLLAASTCWLLLFPNAPYLITDLLHLSQLKGAPQWFDTMLLFTAAVNGVGLAFTSLELMELQWMKSWEHSFVNRFSETARQLFRVATIGMLFLLTGFGIYLGRVLRYNSWDVITDTHDLFADIAHRVINPFNHVSTWSFTILYGVMLAVFYYGWYGTGKHSAAGNSSFNL